MTDMSYGQRNAQVAVGILTAITADTDDSTRLTARHIVGLEQEGVTHREMLQGMMLIAHELLVLYALASGDTREQVLQWLGEKHAES